MNVDLYSYTYNENNNLTESFFQRWNNSLWLNQFKSSYGYNANNTIVEEIFQSWGGSIWNNEVKYSYNYDVNQNLTEKIIQPWDGNSWLTGSINLFTYDENHNQIESLYQIWNGSVWMNHWKQGFTYDGNNNCIESLLQNWDFYNWVNERKDSYAYVPVTEVNEDLSFINSYSLSNNYPNPFNPSTSIKYAVSSRQFVKLKVYDLLGNEVETLVNEEKSAGKYEINWNAANLPSGVYFYRLQAGDLSTSSGRSFVQTRKMILLK